MYASRLAITTYLDGALPNQISQFGYPSPSAHSFAVIRSERGRDVPIEVLLNDNMIVVLVELFSTSAGAV